jgi:hypothetical protein
MSPYKFFRSAVVVSLIIHNLNMGDLKKKRCKSTFNYQSNVEKEMHIQENNEIIAISKIK